MRTDTATPLQPLLADDEPAPLRVAHADGRSRFLLCCDHAGRQLPRALGDLGVSAADLRRHIAWDIGAAEVTQALADALDAFAILQTYSRLAIDCNRPLDAADSIAAASEDTVISGNAALSKAEAARRAQAIFHPYHARLAAELDARAQAAAAPVLVSIHSFTPAYRGVPRPWHVGVLYHRDARLAQALLRLLEDERAWTVGDNQPYAVDDQHDYTVPVHGERRGIAHVELEIRQDLIADKAGQAQWAAHLARLLPRAARDAGV